MRPLAREITFRQAVIQVNDLAHRSQDMGAKWPQSERECDQQECLLLQEAIPKYLVTLTA